MSDVRSVSLVLALLLTALTVGVVLSQQTATVQPAQEAPPAGPPPGADPGERVRGDGATGLGFGLRVDESAT